MKEDGFKALEEALLMGKEQLWTKANRELASFRRDLVVKIANRKAESIPRKLAHFRPSIEPELYLSAQKALRTLWSPATPFRVKQVLVDGWLDEAAKHSRAGSRGFHAWLAREKFEFDLDNFRGQFVTAILENWRRFRICGNPNCPERYFLGKRSTQRYCERGDCTKYAQQKHALKWW